VKRGMLGEAAAAVVVVVAVAAIAHNKL